MLLIFILETAFLAFLCFYAKNRYEALEKMESNGSLVSNMLMPAAIFLVDRFITGRFSTYERKLNAKLSELYGGRDIKCRLRLYMACKTMHMCIAVPSVTLVSLLMDKPGTGYFVFAVAVLLVVLFAEDRELEEKIKKKNFYIQYDFPDFLNKLVLLINAGMTVSRAWEKIVKDRKKVTPLYEELNTAYLEIKNGKPETEAYEDFAKRCRVREITKFVTLVIQNHRKGNGELVTLLKIQSNECWELRKNMARKLGEEASTKLVLPLMIMFVGILVVVMLPAILQLKYL